LLSPGSQETLQTNPERWRAGRKRMLDMQRNMGMMRKLITVLRSREGMDILRDIIYSDVALNSHTFDPLFIL